MSPSRVSSLDFTTFYNVVDGKNRSSKTFHNGINPVTAEKLWDVPIATQEDVEDAVAAADKAFKSWSREPIEKRKELVTKFLDLFRTYKNEFTELIGKECGKPQMMATGEVESVFAWMGQFVKYDLPEEVEEDDERIVTTRYTPLGIVGGICPWNFPLTLSSGKIGPALITGNVIIIKPSPFTPYSSLKLVELMQEVFPPGVVQVLGGDDKLGPMLTSHPKIAKISFTGSIATGKKIYEACAKTLKRVTLELGGNDASIILPDVDIAKVAPKVALGAFLNSGQICVATKRIYVHQDIYEPFLKAMVEFTKTLKVGPSGEEGVMVGPVQNSMQYDKVKTFFKDSKDKGYKFATGGEDVADQKKGYFFQPTIIDNPPNESLIIQEEPFGPIVPCQPWSDEEDVIARANNTKTGLGACVWGKDVKHAEAIGKRLEAGSVFINSYENASPQHFFSGHKESGLGGEWGRLGMLSYCNAHVMHVFKEVA